MTLSIVGKIRVNLAVAAVGFALLFLVSQFGLQSLRRAQDDGAASAKGAIAATRGASVAQAAAEARRMARGLFKSANALMAESKTLEREIELFPGDLRSN